MQFDPSRFDADETERVADSEPKFIESEVFCSQCGYSLFKLLPIGRCPECGNPYEVGSGKSSGVLTSDDAQFPFFDCLATGFCGLIVVWFLAGLVQEFDFWTFLLSVVCGTVGYFYWQQTKQLLKKYKHASRLWQDS